MAAEWLDTALQDLERKQLLRRLRTLAAADEAVMVVDGRRLVNFGSNNYLGLAADPRVRAAAVSAARDWGVGAGASPLVCGHTAYHERLEAALARFKGTEAALVFPSGYAANVGTLGALAGPRDLVLCDRLAHASLLDGASLSRAHLRTFRHNDPDDLTRLLDRERTGRRRCWIVTESVFSMDGDVAPVPALLEAARRFDAGLILDEAHATGVLGDRGRGALEHFDLGPDGIVVIGTLSKALGSQGGFVAGEDALVQWVLNRARSYVFSTALSPVLCAAALTAVEVLQTEPGLVGRLRKLSATLRHGLRAEGEPTPIVPVLVGEPETALQRAAALAEAGLWVPAIRPPSVPRGTARLRVSLSAMHTEAQLTRLAEMLTATA
jgi:8-amino-7-oxononanoate synthase